VHVRADVRHADGAGRCTRGEDYLQTVYPGDIPGWVYYQGG